MADEISRVTEDSARGGFFLFSGATLATVIMAVSTILVGRLLDPELYGQYNLVLVIPTLLLLFSDLRLKLLTRLSKLNPSMVPKPNERILLLSKRK